MFNKYSNRSRRFHLGLISVSAAVLALTTVSYSVSGNDSKSASSQVQTISIPVEGTSCVSCAARVKRSLKRIEGVRQVEVSLEHREAVVRITPDKVSPGRLEAAINELGYKAGKAKVVGGK